METKTVYVIGAKDADIEKIREMTNTPYDCEIILINDMSEIPIAARSTKPLVSEIYPIIAMPRFEQTVFPELRKSHERPYKYHK